jgi:hypothetical protein
MTCRLDATVVLAIAAGSASAGAAIEVKRAEANAAVTLDAAAPPLAQADSIELAAKVPSGNMGALASKLSARRREI